MKGRHAGKQLVRVLDAVEAGCETSDQVSAYTGLSVAICSVYLGNLAEDGMIQLVKREGRWFAPERGGRKSHIYAPKAAARSA